MDRSNLPPRRRTQSVDQPPHRIGAAEIPSRRSWFGSSSSIAASTPSSTSSTTSSTNPYSTRTSYSPPSYPLSSHRLPYEPSCQEANYPHTTYPQPQDYQAHFPHNPRRDPFQPPDYDKSSTSHPAHRQSIPISFLINSTPVSPSPSSSPSIIFPSSQDSTSSSASPHAARSFRHSNTYPDTRAHEYPTQRYPQRLHRVHSSPTQNIPESYTRHRYTERESLPTPPYSRPHDRRSQESHVHQQQPNYPQPHDYRQNYPYPVQHPPYARPDDRPIPPRSPSIQHAPFSPPHRDEPLRQPYPVSHQGFELLAVASDLERQLKREEAFEPIASIPPTRTKIETPRVTEFGRKEAVLEEEEEEEEDGQGGDDDDDEDHEEDEDEEEGEEEGVEASDQVKRKATPPRQVSIRRTNNPDLKTTKTGKIQHKPKRVGINKRSTAYNRFLQQKSKYLAKFQAHLTPQQRMKRIAEEWAVSDKNPHKTRRKSRFLGPTGELLFPSTSSSSQPPIQPQHQSAQEQEPKATELTEPQGPPSSEPN